MDWEIVAVKHKRVNLGAPSLKLSFFSVIFFSAIFSHHELLHHLEVAVLGRQVEASVAKLVCLVHINALDQSLK